MRTWKEVKLLIVIYKQLLMVINCVARSSGGVQERRHRSICLLLVYRSGWYMYWALP